MAKTFLTDEIVESLPIREKEFRTTDTGQKGLQLRSCVSGVKRWYFKTQWGGRNYNFCLGVWPQLSTDQARVAAAEKVREMYAGIPPRRPVVLPAEPLKRGNLFFGEVVQQWIDQHLRPHKSEKSAEEAEQSYRKYFKNFLNRYPDEITVNDATTWIAEIGASSGHATANRQLTNARAAINWARRQELIEVKKNPFERVERFKDAEQPRERYLRPDEIQRLMYELDRIPQQDHAACIKLMLLTCQRPSNVRAMEWTEIDFDGRSWTIPGAKAKAGKSIVVALTPPAIEVLQQLREHKGDSSFCFPSRSETGHVVNLSVAWNTVRERCGFGPDVCLYTLRHTALTMLGQSGASAQVLMKAAGHASSRMSDRYVKMNVDAVLNAQEVAQARMLGGGLLGPMPPNVLSFGKKTAASAEVAAQQNKRPSKREGIVMTAREQRIIEGKILACISSGQTNLTSFHRKIGGCMPCNGSELARILASMESEGLVRKFVDGHQRQYKYALCEEEPVSIAPVAVAPHLSETTTSDDWKAAANAG